MNCPLYGREPTVTVYANTLGIMPSWHHYCVIACCQMGAQQWASTPDEAVAVATASWTKHYQNVVFHAHPLEGLTCYRCGSKDLRAYFEDQHLVWEGEPLNQSYWELACESCDCAHSRATPNTVGAITALVRDWRHRIAAIG